MSAATATERCALEDLEGAIDDLVFEYGSYHDKISSCVRNHQPYANQSPAKYEAARKEVIRLASSLTVEG